MIASGHLDSWDLGTSALDDATGISVAMDVVRIIKSVRAHPKRTIRIASSKAPRAFFWQSCLGGHLKALKLS